MKLFGMAPCPGKDSISITIKFKWLEYNFKPSKKKNEIYKTRAYLFFLVFGQARVSAWQLVLFREFKRYAWGSACLATQYKMLTKARTLLKGEDEEEKEAEGRKF